MKSDAAVGLHCIFCFRAANSTFILEYLFLFFLTLLHEERTTAGEWYPILHWGWALLPLWWAVSLWRGLAQRSKILVTVGCVQQTTAITVCPSTQSRPSHWNRNHAVHMQSTLSVNGVWCTCVFVCVYEEKRVCVICVVCVCVTERVCENVWMHANAHLSPRVSSRQRLRRANSVIRLSF